MINDLKLRSVKLCQRGGGYILKLYKSKNLKAGEVGEKWQKIILKEIRFVIMVKIIFTFEF
jgi:hypothetical protein